jgi:hypothetical protein
LDLSELSASARPIVGTVYPIADLYRRLLKLVGTEVSDPGHTQDRLRGVALQQLAVPALGLGWYADAGQFPDVLCQVLELKLQTSATIDLGLVSPDDTSALEGLGHPLAHKDVRYGIVYAERLTVSTVRVTDVVVTTGESFFTEFRRFGGLVRNRKLQIRLPRGFFNV